MSGPNGRITRIKVVQSCVFIALAFFVIFVFLAPARSSSETPEKQTAPESPGWTPAASSLSEAQTSDNGTNIGSYYNAVRRRETPEKTRLRKIWAENEKKKREALNKIKENKRKRAQKIDDMKNIVIDKWADRSYGGLKSYSSYYLCPCIT